MKAGHLYDLIQLLRFSFVMNILVTKQEGKQRFSWGTQVCNALKAKRLKQKREINFHEKRWKTIKGFCTATTLGQPTHKINEA